MVTRSQYRLFRVLVSPALLRIGSPDPWCNERMATQRLWWVMVIYSICILLMIYTYQFDNMPMYWHNATGLSDQW